jgi:hypothetical protein
MSASIIKSVIFVVASVLLSTAYAATVTEVQSLRFGKIVVIENNAQHRMVVRPNGSIATAAKILIIEPGQPGIFQLNDFPASTSINASLNELADPTSSFSEGGVPTAQFQIEPFFDFTSYITDVNGQMDIPMGGNLTTSGNGQRYQDGVYYRYFNINFNY